MLTTLPKSLESSSMPQCWEGSGSRMEKGPLAYGKALAALRLRQTAAKTKLASRQHAPALCALRVYWRLQFWEERDSPSSLDRLWVLRTCCRAVAMLTFVGSLTTAAKRSPMSDCADPGKPWRILLCLRLTGGCFALLKVISRHMVAS